MIIFSQWCQIQCMTFLVVGPLYHIHFHNLKIKKGFIIMNYFIFKVQNLDWYQGQDKLANQTRYQCKIPLPYLCHVCLQWWPEVHGKVHDSKFLKFFTVCLSLNAFMLEYGKEVKENLAPILSSLLMNKILFEVKRTKSFRHWKATSQTSFNWSNGGFVWNCWSANDASIWHISLLSHA